MLGTLTLLAALASPQHVPRLESVYGRADAWTLALSADERRLFLSEGAVICVYDAADLPPRDETRLASIPIDASVLSLAATPERLFVAGGSHGLFRVELGERPWRAELVDDAGRKVCIDVVAAGERVFATFLAEGASEVRGYAVGVDGPAFVVDDIDARAIDSAFDGQHLYLALNEAGLGRVTVSTDEPRFEPGPGPDAFPVPADFERGPARVRAVTVLGERLCAAAGVCGLATLALGEPWSPETRVTLRPLTAGGRPTYAGRIDADGDRLVVGGHKGPVLYQDGAPYTTYGKLGFNGQVADTEVRGFELGTKQTLTWFRDDADDLVLEGVAELGGGWGDLLLRGKHVWGNYTGKGQGFRLSDLDADEHGLHAYNPMGFAAADGVLSGVREGALLFGVDSACSGIAGLPELGADGVLRPIPGSRDLKLGFAVGPRWPGPRPQTEWVLGGHGFHAELFLLDWSSSELEVARWKLQPPLSPNVERGEGRRDLRRYRGREFFLGTKVDDLLLLTTRGTRYGLIGWSASQLTAAAERTRHGAALRVRPLFQVETQPGGSEELCFTWRTDVYEARDGRRILALAAGLDADPQSATHLRPRLALYELTGELEAPRLLARVHPPNLRGNLMGVRVAERDGRSYAYAADGGFGLHAFDVTVPEEARLVTSWGTEPNVADGHYDNVIDVDLWEAPDGTLLAYVAAVRLGVAVLDVGDPEAGLEVVGSIDTPGLAFGVEVATVRGAPKLIVGDHQAGLRVYALE